MLRSFLKKYNIRRVFPCHMYKLCLLPDHLKRVILFLVLLSAFQAQAETSSQSEQLDITQLPLEQLLDMEVITASKFAQKVTDAPSAVTIITAEDIKAYGYRTLADILNSVRGLYTTYDRAYQYLGGRGFGRPGDYTGRIMLLIDGYPADDNLYNQSYLGDDGLIDTALIERVEYVPGSGSAIYGNNAFFGIINVITKKGSDFKGTQVAAEIGSYQTEKLRATYGNRLENGADLLLSASGLDSKGQTLVFPELSPDAVRNLDYENNQRLFGKMHYQEFTLEGAYVNRMKGIPTAPYGSDLNQPNYYEDTNAFLSARYDTDLGRQLKFSAHSYYGYYAFHQTALYSGIVGKETDLGEWWGLDVKFVGSWYERHKLVFGMEYRDDYRQDFTIDPLMVRHNASTTSLYLQDEITLTEQLVGNVGARYDYNSDSGGTLSPRFALIYFPSEMTTAKISYGIAHRIPNAYEKYYDLAGTQTANPELRPESVHTAELALEHKFNPDTRLLASLYRYWTNDLISLVAVPGNFQNQNVASTHTTGAEIELERHWDSGIRLRSSYAWQLAKDENDRQMANSPRHLGKFNVTFPFLQNMFRSGFELQYVGPRNTEQGQELGSYTVANLTMTSDRLLANVEISASIRNLFNRQYAEVAPALPANSETTIRQDGRNYWLQLIYNFR